MFRLTFQYFDHHKLKALMFVFPFDKMTTPSVSEVLYKEFYDILLITWSKSILKIF